MNKKGFTLVELLVVISIIGVLSSTVVTSLIGVTDRARGSNIITNMRAIDKAFTLKALDDNISSWWLETDFPEESSWSVYISDLSEGSISEFLPIAPEVPDANTYDYAYDNDGNLTESLPCDANSTNSSESSNTFHRTVTGGVNIVIGVGAHYTTTRFQEIFTVLDNAFDKGDGPVCGKIRTHGFENNPYNVGRNTQRFNIRYIIDFDQKPNH